MITNLGTLTLEIKWHGHSKRWLWELSATDNQNIFINGRDKDKAGAYDQAMQTAPMMLTLIEKSKEVTV